MSIKTPDWVKDAIFYQIFPDRFATSGRASLPTNLETWASKPTPKGFKRGGYILGKPMMKIAWLDESANSNIHNLSGTTPTRYLYDLGLLGPDVTVPGKYINRATVRSEVIRRANRARITGPDSTAVFIGRADGQGIA